MKLLFLTQFACSKQYFDWKFCWTVHVCSIGPYGILLYYTYLQHRTLWFLQVPIVFSLYISWSETKATEPHLWLLMYWLIFFIAKQMFLSESGVKTEFVAAHKQKIIFHHFLKIFSNTVKTRFIATASLIIIFLYLCCFNENKIKTFLCNLFCTLLYKNILQIY